MRRAIGDMGYVYNHSAMLARRRELRGRMTGAEILFWHEVKNRRILGVKFRRQYSVHSYVVDFYAPIPRLVVEIDGEYHLDIEIQQYDRKREEEIEACGIRFLRFTNDEMYNDMTGVLVRLSDALRLAVPSLNKEG